MPEEDEMSFFLAACVFFYQIGKIVFFFWCAEGGSTLIYDKAIEPIFNKVSPMLEQAKTE